MKRRILVLLAAVLVVAPASLAAQRAFGEDQPHFTISPYFGYAFAYNQHGTVRFRDASGVYTATYRREVQGGVMPGVAVEYHAPGRFGLSAAGGYNRRGDETLSTDYVDVAPLTSPGSTMWFVRGALTMDLREGPDDLRLARSNAHLALGPAMVREVPDAATGRLPYNAFAVNGAASAEFPLPWKGLAFRGSFDDYMAFLPMADVGLQLAANVSNQIGRPFLADLSGGTTHIFVLQAGLSYHF